MEKMIPATMEAYTSANTRDDLVGKEEYIKYKMFSAPYDSSDSYCNKINKAVDEFISSINGTVLNVQVRTREQDYNDNVRILTEVLVTYRER